jgi:hypothetical protein
MNSRVSARSSGRRSSSAIARSPSLGAHMDDLNRERDELAAALIRLTGHRPPLGASREVTYGVTIHLELDALVQALAAAHCGASDAHGCRRIIASAVRRGLHDMAADARAQPIAEAAMRARSHLDTMPATDDALTWRERIDELTRAVARARVVYADERDVDKIIEGVRGEAFVRGLETLAFEHGLGRVGEPLLLNRILASFEHEVFQAAAMAREAALLARRDAGAALSLLARAFPSLRYGATDGIRSWDADRLAAWAMVAGRADSERASSAFVLWVHGGDGDRVENSPRFDLESALRAWDAAHRVVLAVWSSDPWWGPRVC